MVDVLQESVSQLSDEETKVIELIAEHLRRSSFSTIQKAGSGHLGACSSSAELMATLYFGGILKFDPSNPQNPNRDNVLVRGHLGPLRYKIFSILGLIDEGELDTYRQIGSRLKGHESMHSMPGVDITPSGSLGMILSYAVGAAIKARQVNSDSLQYVFLGDGEEQEGNIAEAARHAASMKLDNIICLMDKNGKQLSRDTKHSDGATDIKLLWQAYGWNVLEIDGHNVREIYESLTTARPPNKPTILIANTIKGKGIEGCEQHYSGYHTISTCKPELVSEATKDPTELTTDKVRELITGKIQKALIEPSPNLESPASSFQINVHVNPSSNVNLDDSQYHYFTTLRKTLEALKNPPRFYMLTADFVRADIVRAAKLDQFMKFIDVGIREQHMIGMAHGISTSDPQARILINYGDAFLYRAADQLNAAAQGSSNMTILSEYAGLSQGQNGETHQSVGQPICLSTIPGVKFYEPGDVQDLFNVLNNSLSSNKGISYIRIHRENVNPLPRIDHELLDLRNYAVRNPQNPDAVLVASGLMVGNTLEAAEQIKETSGLDCRVVNVVQHDALYADFAEQFLAEGKPVFTFYNGHPRTLGDTVSQSIFSSANCKKPSYIRNHGYTLGETGKPKELLRHFGLDTKGIVDFFNKHYIK